LKCCSNNDHNHKSTNKLVIFQKNNDKNILNPLSFPPYTVFYRLLAPLPLHGLFSIYLYAVFRLFCTSLFPYFHQGKFRNLIKYGGVERTNGSTRRIHQTTMG